MARLLLLLTVIPWMVVSSSCPDGTPCNYTCCSSPDEGYFCCPFDNAYCCSDGHSCASSPSLCRSADAYQNYTSLQEITISKASEQVGIVCPGGRYSCPDDNTCCPTSTSYSCCPYPSAVCCVGGYHCCPTFYTCNPASFNCVRANNPQNFQENHLINKSLVPMMKIQTQSNNCSDGIQCPLGSTCCKTSPNTYGCCPSQQATININDKSNETCPDGSTCPADFTCCQKLGGKYGCCPYRNAVCCNDGEHCCPNGSVCDTVKQQCIKDLQNTPMRKKQKAFYFRKSFV